MNVFTNYIKALQCPDAEKEFLKFKSIFSNFSHIIILGNGGSNSVASHISQDCMKFKNKSVSIFSDPSMLTMLANDFGYENAFVKFLEYNCKLNTLVILISSSGESQNILNCQKYCEHNKLGYGVLTGFESKNSLKSNAFHALFNYHVDSDSYGVVECVHQIFLHAIMDCD
jgi:D-sedoheptulose 7-phosphate isomerase